MSFDRIERSVERYYTGRIAEHGATARGVDWNSDESQRLRFHQLLRAWPVPQSPVSVLDYGCGYGALRSHLDESGWPASYLGFDLAPAMLVHARERFGDRADCSFTAEEPTLDAADYVIASGIFNVRLETAANAWAEYMEHVVGRLAALARRGFSFNVLTSYSDADKQRADLYYADPVRWFDHCKRRHSRHVTLFHDYPLYEFTLAVTL